jgi:hypothetical protein
MKPLIFSAQLSDYVSLVGFAVVPDYDHMPSQMLKQVAEEFSDLEFCDVALMKAVIKAEAISYGTHGYA